LGFYRFLLNIYRSVRNRKSLAPLLNVNLIDKAKGQTFRSALLSYITHPFNIEQSDPKFLTHINYWHSQEIVRILNSMGYEVDIIDFRDKAFIPSKNYDLFIGHGGINFEKIYQYLEEATVKVYFSTGSYWKFHNEQELLRLKALNKRRGSNLQPDRIIKSTEERGLSLADGIIGIGNNRVKKTYNFPQVYMVNSTALDNHHYDVNLKNLEKGRENYVYYAGSGCIHKGLDLLLEAFSQLEEHLWVCSEIDREFENVYQMELYNTNNIHLVGWMQPRSDLYYDVLDKCNYVILPSCSEGGPGSIVECMNLGLVPVVSLNSGIDVENYGIYLDPCNIEQIIRNVKYLSSVSLDAITMMSSQSRNAAKTTYSQVAFSNGFKQALEEIKFKKDQGV
jgi:glycosyltransferase involved in cell wall biosynthesis